MKKLKVLSYLLCLSILLFACSSDDDTPSEVDDPSNNEELSFDIGSSDRSFGNSYVTYEGSQTGVDFYRLHILPPGATFDSSSGVFTGGSTGDYLTLDFKVPENEDFLISGDYAVGYQVAPFTVEGIFYSDVTVNLEAVEEAPTLFVPEGSEDVMLEIDEDNFTIVLDVMGAQASGIGEINDVEIFGNYSSSYQFIDLD